MKRVGRCARVIAGVIILAFFVSLMEKQSFFNSIAAVADTNPHNWKETITVSGFTVAGSTATLYWDGPSTEQPFGTISDYNLFLFGDHIQENADSEGPVFVLGDAAYNSSKWTCGDVNVNVGYTYYTDLSYRNGNFSGGYAPTYVLGGDLNVNELGVDNGSFLHDAGSNISSTSISCSGGGQIYDVAAGEIAAFAGSAQSSIISQMQGLKAKSKKVFGHNVDSGNIALGEDTRDTGTNTHIIEYDAGGQTAYGISITGFNLAADNLIINVTGDPSQLFASYLDLTIDGVSMGGDYMRISEYAPYILWNFVDYTGTINSNANVCGSVIAPQAKINATAGNINGNVVANSLEAGAGYECHSMFFRWNTASASPSSSPSTSPSSSPGASPSGSPSASPSATPSGQPSTTPTAKSDTQDPSEGNKENQEDEAKKVPSTVPKKSMKKSSGEVPDLVIVVPVPEGKVVQPGDEYVLYEAEKPSEIIDTLVVNENGQLELTNLTVGRTYYIVAPDGAAYKINYTGPETKAEAVDSRKFAVIPKTGEESIFSSPGQLIKSIWNNILALFN